MNEEELAKSLLGENEEEEAAKLLLSDAAPVQTSSGVSPVETTMSNINDILLMGYGPEVMAGMSTLGGTKGDYKKTRDAYRARDQAGANDNRKSAILGKTIGLGAGAFTPNVAVSKVPSIANWLAKFGKYAAPVADATATGATYGGLANTEGEGFDVVNRAKNALTGSLAGFGIGSGMAGLTKGGESLYKRPFKNIDAEANVLHDTPISDLALSEGVTGNPQTIYEKLLAIKSRAGQQIGSGVARSQERFGVNNIVDGLENSVPNTAGQMGSKENVISFIKKELKAVADMKNQPGMQKYAQELANYEAELLKFNNRPNTGGLMGNPLPPVKPVEPVFPNQITTGDLFDVKVGAGQNLKTAFANGEVPLSKEAKGALYDYMNKNTRDPIARASTPEQMAVFNKAMEDYGTIASNDAELFKAAKAWQKNKSILPDVRLRLNGQKGLPITYEPSEFLMTNVGNFMNKAGSSKLANKAAATIPKYLARENNPWDFNREGN